jgi:hypothetical protein
MYNLTDQFRLCKQCKQLLPSTLEFFKEMLSRNGKKYLINTCRKCAASKRRLDKLKSMAIEGKYSFCVLPGYKHCYSCETTLEQENFWKKSFQCINCCRKYTGAKARRKGRETNDNERECFVCNTVLNIDNFPDETPYKGEKRKKRFCRNCFNVKIKNKLKNDIQYRLKFLLRNSVRKHLFTYKSCKTMNLIGCTIDEFKLHIESQWLNGMSWSNYGKSGWHLDHIVPCAAFDLTQKESQLICFNYKNYAPLWGKDNISKGDKLPNGENARNLTKKITNEIELNNLISCVYA